MEYKDIEKKLTIVAMKDISDTVKSDMLKHSGFFKKISLYTRSNCALVKTIKWICRSFVGTSKKIGRTETEEQLKDRIWNPLTIHEIHSLAS